MSKTPITDDLAKRYDAARSLDERANIGAEALEALRRLELELAALRANEPHIHNCSGEKP